MNFTKAVGLVFLIAVLFTSCASHSQPTEVPASQPIVNTQNPIAEPYSTVTENADQASETKEVVKETPKDAGAESLIIPMEEKKMDGNIAVLETTLGTIEIELYDNMPITAGNFKKLVSKGFYDGVIFHRIIAGFMVQGGDPDGTGMGGPGYTIKDEFAKPNKNDRGTISMANAGPNTGGSQFFLNLVNNNFLDDKHPVFGKITKGMDVLDKLGAVKVGANDRPIQEVKIIKATLR